MQSQNYTGHVWLSFSEAYLTLQSVSVCPASLNTGLSVCDGHRHLSLRNIQNESRQQPFSICTACLALSLCLSLTLTLMTLHFFFVLERHRIVCLKTSTQIQSWMAQTPQCIRLTLTVSKSFKKRPAWQSVGTLATNRDWINMEVNQSGSNPQSKTTESKFKSPHWED